MSKTDINKAIEILQEIAKEEDYKPPQDSQSELQGVLNDILDDFVANLPIKATEIGWEKIGEDIRNTSTKAIASIEAYITTRVKEAEGTFSLAMAASSLNRNQSNEVMELYIGYSDSENAKNILKNSIKEGERINHLTTTTNGKEK